MRPGAGVVNQPGRHQPNRQGHRDGQGGAIGVAPAGAGAATGGIVAGVLVRVMAVGRLTSALPRFVTTDERRREGPPRGWPCSAEIAVRMLQSRQDSPCQGFELIGLRVGQLLSALCLDGTDESGRIRGSWRRIRALRWLGSRPRRAAFTFDRAHSNRRDSRKRREACRRGRCADPPRPR